jgi:hypothetical protein
MKKITLTIKIEAEDYKIKKIIEDVKDENFEGAEDGIKSFTVTYKLDED